MAENTVSTENGALCTEIKVYMSEALSCQVCTDHIIVCKLVLNRFSELFLNIF